MPDHGRVNRLGFTVQVGLGAHYLLPGPSSVKLKVGDLRLSCPTFLRLLDSLKLYTSLSDIVVLKVSNTATYCYSARSVLTAVLTVQCSAVVSVGLYLVGKPLELIG